jgi:hypothetical protein
MARFDMSVLARDPRDRGRLEFRHPYGEPELRLTNVGCSPCRCETVQLLRQLADALDLLSFPDWKEEHRHF